MKILEVYFGHNEKGNTIADIKAAFDIYSIGWINNTRVYCMKSKPYFRHNGKKIFIDKKFF